MGDISEQRQARLSITPDLLQQHLGQHLGQRQGRRLSNVVGLDQVKIHQLLFFYFLYINSLIKILKHVLYKFVMMSKFLCTENPASKTKTEQVQQQ